MIKKTKTSNGYIIDITMVIFFVVIICALSSILLNIYMLKSLKILELDSTITRGLFRNYIIENNLLHKPCHSKERTHESTEKTSIP